MSDSIEVWMGRLGKTVYEVSTGKRWKVIGIITRPSVILEDEAGHRMTPALDSPIGCDLLDCQRAR